MARLGKTAVEQIRQPVRSDTCLFRDFAASVEASLAKDTERGSRVFDDYAAFHPSPIALRVGQ